MRICRIISTILVLTIGILLSACGNAQGNANTSATYQVAPSFREFYETLGGENVLGAAISKNFTMQSYECQYTVNSLMCINPLVTDASRFFLYPLGDSMNVSEDPAQSPAQSGDQVVNGYTIYYEFTPLYNQLSAERYVGKPLTQAHLNYSQNRIEQFFQNVGFYRKFSDPAGTVHLLAYGAYSCTDDCNYTPSVEAAIINASKASSDQPLLFALAKMGDTSVLGQPLTQPYIASDGMEEQVYENAVIYAPPADLSKAKLRAITQPLGYTPSDPVTQQYGSANGVTFYPVQGSKGFHVPLVFDKFIADHGGLDFSGQPIDEAYQYDTNIARQCFENYCLDYDASAADGQKVHMAPLGKEYLNQIGGSSATAPPPLEISPSTITLQVNEQTKEVSASNPQKIDILVLRNDNQQPVSNIEADLTITLPDGSFYSATFSQTGLDGRASLIVPSMSDVSNGTILVYQVCLKGASEPVCASGSYLIWNTP